MKPISLNQQRKARARSEEKAKADENAVRFGRTKAARLLDAAKDKKARAHLGQIKFEDD